MMGSGITSIKRRRDIVQAASSPPTWRPTDVTGCVLWLPPVAGFDGYMYTANPPVAEVTSDGQSVGYWEDASGTGNPASQSSAVSRGTYHTNVQNSLPMVAFDGADFLSVNGVASSIAGNDNAYTIAIVFKLDDALGIDTLFSAGRSATSSTMLRIAPNGGSYQCFKQDDAGANATITGSVVTRDTSAHLWLLRFNGTTVDAWIDTTQINSASAQNVGQCTFDVATLGKLLSFGVSQDFINTGSIGEVIVWNNAISNTDATTVRTELISKWGL